MSKETTTVKILGASYKIACPPEESEEVKKAAVFLDNKPPLKKVESLTMLKHSAQNSNHYVEERHHSFSFNYFQVVLHISSTLRVFLSSSGSYCLDC